MSQSVNIAKFHWSIKLFLFQRTSQKLWNLKFNLQVDWLCKVRIPHEENHGELLTFPVYLTTQEPMILQNTLEKNEYKGFTLLKVRLLIKFSIWDKEITSYWDDKVISYWVKSPIK